MWAFIVLLPCASAVGLTVFLRRAAEPPPPQTAAEAVDGSHALGPEPTVCEATEHDKCRLPSQNALMETSIDEVRRESDRYGARVTSVFKQLQPLHDAPESTSLEACRDAIRETNADYVRQQIQAALRIRRRHHSGGTFGETSAGLCEAIDHQTKRILLANERLDALGLKSDVLNARRELNAETAELIAGNQRLQDSLDAMCLGWTEKRGAKPPKSDFEPFDEPFVRRKMARALTCWWTLHADRFGAVAVALLDADLLQAYCNLPDRRSGERLLYSIARLAEIAGRDLGSSSADARSVLTATTEVDSAEGRRQTVAWSCTLVVNAAGYPESVLGTGTLVGDEQPINRQAKTTSPANVSEVVASERRQKPRTNYPFVQLIGPMRDANLPPLATFYEVRCKDISPGGISFLSPTPPGAETLVIALGTSAPFKYLKANVRHSKKIQHQGQTIYVVGCHFTGRAAY